MWLRRSKLFVGFVYQDESLYEAGDELCPENRVKRENKGLTPSNRDLIDAEKPCGLFEVSNLETSVEVVLAQSIGVGILASGRRLNLNRE